MLVNTILQMVLAPFRFLLMVIAPISTCVIGISFAIPLWQSTFRLLMAVIWLPFLCYINATSQLYQKVTVFRPLLALISIPLLLLLDIFVALMPGSHRTDKYDKASLIDSWPFSSWSGVSDMPSKEIQRGLVKSYLNNGEVMPVNGRQYSYSADTPISNGVKVFTVGNKINEDVKRISRYDKPLRVHQSFPDQSPGNPVPANGQQQSHKVSKSSNIRHKISTCTLCGDMVRADWERCPHCDEPLEGLLRLPAIWYRKAAPANGKAYQFSR